MSTENQELALYEDKMAEIHDLWLKTLIRLPKKKVKTSQKKGKQKRAKGFTLKGLLFFLQFNSNALPMGLSFLFFKLVLDKVACP